MMALQRNLKALGTFGYQTTARSNPVYIQYIPRTLRYVSMALDAAAAIRQTAAGCSPAWSRNWNRRSSSGATPQDCVHPIRIPACCTPQ